MQLDFAAWKRGPAPQFAVNTILALGQWLLLAVLAVQVARLVWAVLAPVGPLGAPRPAATPAPAILKDFDAFFRLQAPSPQATPQIVTSLKLTLFGIRLNEASGRGGAIIAGEDGQQKSYAVGEEIAPGVVLKAVAFDHVTLNRNGADEDLFIDQSGGAAPAGPAAMQSPLASMQGGGPGPAGKSGITLQKLRAEVGFIPRIDNGRVTGLVVRPQASGTVFRQVGLKEGDIVTQIGGRPVSGPSDLESLAGQFAKGGNISLTVERGADLLPLVISVDPQ